jgi:sugar fermentation stimulation protein A
VLPNRQKIMLRCPNIGKMQGCDILGTRVWYSHAMGYNCLATWELAEVDGGSLVCINPELMKPLVLEAIKKNLINELQDYNILHAGGQYDQFRSQFILLEKDQQQCYMGIEQVITSGEHGVGIFPGSIGDGQDNLQALMQAREDGHRAVLLYCVMNSGISYVKPALQNDPEYNNLLLQAAEEGVEILAYRANIDLSSIELTTPIPVIYREKAKSRL